MCANLRSCAFGYTAHMYDQAVVIYNHTALIYDPTTAVVYDRTAHNGICINMSARRRRQVRRHDGEGEARGGRHEATDDGEPRHAGGAAAAGGRARGAQAEREGAGRRGGTHTGQSVSHQWAILCILVSQSVTSMHNVMSAGHFNADRSTFVYNFGDFCPCIDRTDCMITTCFPSHFDRISMRCSHIISHCCSVTLSQIRNEQGIVICGAFFVIMCGDGTDSLCFLVYARMLCAAAAGGAVTVLTRCVHVSVMRMRRRSRRSCGAWRRRRRWTRSGGARRRCA